MPALTDEIKEFIVKGLACFDTPTQVAEAVRVNFGVEVTRQQVFSYDATAARQPAPRWVALHAAVREQFLSEKAGVSISHRAVRLRMLERFARRAEANNYTERAAGFLEQAAKECGGLYENRRAVVLVQQPVPQPPEQRTPEPKTLEQRTLEPASLEFQSSEIQPQPQASELQAPEIERPSSAPQPDAASEERSESTPAEALSQRERYEAYRRKLREAIALDQRGGTMVLPSGRAAATG